MVFAVVSKGYVLRTIMSFDKDGVFIPFQLVEVEVEPRRWGDTEVDFETTEQDLKADKPVCEFEVKEECDRGKDCSFSHDPFRVQCRRAELKANKEKKAAKQAKYEAKKAAAGQKKTGQKTAPKTGQKTAPKPAQKTGRKLDAAKVRPQVSFLDAVKKQPRQPQPRPPKLTVEVTTTKVTLTPAEEIVVADAVAEAVAEVVSEQIVPDMVVEEPSVQVIPSQQPIYNCSGCGQVGQWNICQWSYFDCRGTMFFCEGPICSGCYTTTTTK